MNRIVVLLSEKPARHLGRGKAAIEGARFCEPPRVDNQERVGFVEGLVSGDAAAGHRPALRMDDWK